MAQYDTACFCGSVKLRVSGEPAIMGYCHCSSCRHWSASPISALTLWPSDAVQVTQGAEHIGSFNRTPNSQRKWCQQCGGHLLAELPAMGLTDVYAALLPHAMFKPTLHVNYAESVLPIRDGLPKFKDLPKEAGGSGEMMAE